MTNLPADIRFQSGIPFSGKHKAANHRSSAATLADGAPTIFVDVELGDPVVASHVMDTRQENRNEVVYFVVVMNNDDE